MATPTINGTVAGQRWNPGTTSFAVTLPSGVAAGELLVVIVGRHLDDLSTTATGWSRQAQFSGPSGYGATSVFTKVAAGGETSVTIDGLGTQNANDVSEIAFRTSGQHATPFYIANGGTGTSTTPNPPNLAPGVGADDFLWLAYFGCRGQANYSAAPSSYTLTKNVNGSGFTTVSMGLAERALNAASEDPGTFTISGSREWCAATFGIRGATASGVTGTGSGSLALGGTGAATVDVLSAGSGAFALVGAGTGTVPVVGTGTGALALSGSGAATCPVNAAGTGTLTLGSTGAGLVEVRGDGSGAMTLGGTGTTAVGSTPVNASGSGSIALAGSGSAAVPVISIGAGALTFAGAGTAFIEVRGTGAGAFALAGSGEVFVGNPPVIGTGSGALALLGAGNAVVAVSASGVGVFVLGAAAVANVAVLGMGAGALVLSGSGNAIAAEPSPYLAIRGNPTSSSRYRGIPTSAPRYRGRF